MATISFALIYLQAAQQKFRETSNGNIRPDQYEINTIAARVIAERYKPKRDRGLRTLGRAALIAPMSETRFARYRAKGLPREEQIAACKRSIGHLAFAAQLVFSPDSYAQREDILQKAAEILV